MGRFLGFLLVVLAACGAQAPAPPLAAPPVSAAPPIRAATSGDYPPLSLWKGDAPEGFAPAILRGFAETQHARVAWTRFAWPGLAADMRAGAFDVVADGITVRADRSISGRFTVPIARGGAVLLTRTSAYGGVTYVGQSPREIVAAIRGPGLRVAVNAGGYLEGVTRRLLSGADIRTIPDNAAVREAFVRGEVDAVMTNTFEAPRWRAGLSGVDALGPLTNDVTALWLRADEGELAEKIDAWLIDEEATGRLEKLRARWLGAGISGPTAGPVDALIAATAERLALMPLVAAAKKRTGEGVEQIGQEARVLAAAEDAVNRAAGSRGSPPPSRERVDEFFRAQIDAAKFVQEHAIVPADSPPPPSLTTELRPAIARIAARMAFLLVRVPSDVSREDVIKRARVDLADASIQQRDVDRIAAAIAAMGDR